jgi:hypothetical protein
MTKTAAMMIIATTRMTTETMDSGKTGYVIAPTTNTARYDIPHTDSTLSPHRLEDPSSATETSIMMDTMTMRKMATLARITHKPSSMQFMTNVFYPTTNINSQSNTYIHSLYRLATELNL